MKTEYNETIERRSLKKKRREIFLKSREKKTKRKTKQILEKSQRTFSKRREEREKKRTHKWLRKKERMADA